MNRVLVTGASGFVGRQVTPLLTAAGWEVIPVRRADADLRDPVAAERLAARVRPTHLLHLAWNAEHGVYWTAPDNEQWADGAIALARGFAAHGGRRFVGAGTCAEYDWSALAGPCVEGITPLRPHSVYGRAKLRAWEGIERIARDAGITAAWARLFFLYGPGEDPRRLVPSVVRALKAGQRPAVTEGTQVRDFLHVADAAAALFAIMDSDLEGPVNIGSGVATAVRQVVETLARAAGRPDAVDFGVVPMPANEPKFVVASTARLRTTGWRPAVDLGAGLAAC